MGEWTLVTLDVINMNDSEDKNYDDIPLISSDYDHISRLISVGMYVFICICFRLFWSI